MGRPKKSEMTSKERAEYEKKQQPGRIRERKRLRMQAEKLREIATKCKIEDLTKCLDHLCEVTNARVTVRGGQMRPSDLQKALKLLNARRFFDFRDKMWKDGVKDILESANIDRPKGATDTDDPLDGLLIVGSFLCQNGGFKISKEPDAWETIAPEKLEDEEKEALKKRKALLVRLRNDFAKILGVEPLQMPRKPPKPRVKAEEQTEKTVDLDKPHAALGEDPEEVEEVEEVDLSKLIAALEEPPQEPQVKVKATQPQATQKPEPLVKVTMAAAKSIVSSLPEVFELTEEPTQFLEFVRKTHAHLNNLGYSLMTCYTADGLNLAQVQVMDKDHQVKKVLVVFEAETVEKLYIQLARRFNRDEYPEKGGFTRPYFYKGNIAFIEGDTAHFPVQVNGEPTFKVVPLYQTSPKSWKRAEVPREVNNLPPAKILTTPRGFIYPDPE